jgi:hypothetical protein
MEWTAEEINEHIDKFLDIATNPIPEDAIVTIWCEGENMEESGFADNTKFDDIGLNMFIAKKWILQSELDGLLKKSYPNPEKSNA